jgi:uncharacterized protein (DUF427 family)
MMTYEQAKVRWQASYPPRHYLSIGDLNREAAQIRCCRSRTP